MSSERIYSRTDVARIFAVEPKRVQYYLNSETLVCSEDGYFREYDLLETLYFRPFTVENLRYAKDYGDDEDLRTERLRLLLALESFQFSFDKTLRKTLRVNEVCMVLGYSARNSVYRLMRSGKLHMIKGDLRFRLVATDELREFVMHKKYKPTPEPAPLGYSTNQIAALLDVCSAAVCKWCKNGQLIGQRTEPRGKWFIRHENLILFLRENPSYVSWLRKNRLTGLQQITKDKILSELEDVQVYSREEIGEIFLVTGSCVTRWIHAGWLVPSSYSSTGHAIFDQQSIANFVEKRPEYRAVLSARNGVIEAVRKNCTDYNRRREDTKVS